MPKSLCAYMTKNIPIPFNRLILESFFVNRIVVVSSVMKNLNSKVMIKMFCELLIWVYFWNE
jgi:hypothetical protein